MMGFLQMRDYEASLKFYERVVIQDRFALVVQMEMRPAYRSTLRNLADLRTYVCPGYA